MEFGFGTGKPNLSVAGAVAVVSLRRSGRRLAAEQAAADFDTTPDLVTAISRDLSRLLKTLEPRPW